jgi:septal ring factor EnvC (AmiA/AmiB activator)
VLTRLCAAFFNADNARAQLSDDIQLYIEREIGRFFASDTGGAILRLKNDLTESIAKQSAAYKETMENIGHIMATSISKISDSMIETTTAIGPTVAAAMDAKLINMNDSMTGILQGWEKAIGEATGLQATMNESSEKLTHAVTKLQSSSELLATHMQGHSGALSTQLVTLVDAIDGIKKSVDHFAAQQEALAQQTKYIEANQKTLDASLHAYEDALKGLTGSLGEGLGAFINLHAETSAQTINDALKSNVDQMKSLLASKGRHESERHENGDGP